MRGDLEKTSGDFSGGFRPLGKGRGGRGAGSHPDPEIRGVPKIILFRLKGPQFGLKIRGGGGQALP